MKTKLCEMFKAGGFTFLFVLSVLFGTGCWSVANAQVLNNLYSNKFVGLDFQLPEGWYIATDDELNVLMSDGTRVMGFDDPSVKEIVSKMPGKVLLMVSERPLSSESQRFNRNIGFVAINARDVKNEIRSGKDYIDLVLQGMKEHLPNASFSEVFTRILASEEFHGFNVNYSMDGVHVHQTQFARIHNDYILIINMTADYRINLAELVQITDKNTRLYTVSQEVDKSPEGESFRAKSTMDELKSKSSGRNIFKTIGIILIVLGALKLLGNLG